MKTALVLIMLIYCLLCLNSFVVLKNEVKFEFLTLGYTIDNPAPFNAHKKCCILIPCLHQLELKVSLTFAFLKCIIYSIII